MVNVNRFEGGGQPGHGLTCESDSFAYPATLDTALLLDGNAIGDRIGLVIDQIERLGVSVHPASRLREYQKILSSDTSRSVSVVLKQNLALLESLQFAAIARAFATGAPCDPWINKLRSAVGGAVWAEDDSSSSRARSDQCELHLMAVLIAAGLQVAIHEPDLHVQLDESTVVAIAAKRPRSRSKLMKNARHAACQIAKLGVPGLVFLDLTFVKHVPKPLYVSSVSAIQVPAMVILDEYARSNWNELLKVARIPFVQGILLYLTCVVRSLKPHVILPSRRWLIIGDQPRVEVARIARSIQRVTAMSST